MGATVDDEIPDLEAKNARQPMKAITLLYHDLADPVKKMPAVFQVSHPVSTR